MAIGATVVRAQPRRNARPQVAQRPSRERQHEDAVGGRAAAFDPIHHALDQGRGFAGAGSGQHEQRSPGVLDDGTLGWIQHWGVGSFSAPESSGTSRPSWSRDDQPVRRYWIRDHRQIGAHRPRAVLTCQFRHVI